MVEEHEREREYEEKNLTPIEETTKIAEEVSPSTERIKYQFCKEFKVSKNFKNCTEEYGRKNANQLMNANFVLIHKECICLITQR